MKINYNPEISLGVIVEVISVVGAILGVYVSIRSTLSEHEVKITTAEKEIIRIEAQALDRDKAQWEAISKGIGGIRNDIQNMNSRIDTLILQPRTIGVVPNVRERVNH